MKYVWLTLVCLAIAGVAFYVIMAYATGAIGTAAAIFIPFAIGYVMGRLHKRKKVTV